MENKIYNDDVERIVNNNVRRHTMNAAYNNRQERRHKKMLIDACVYASFSAAFALLGCFSWLTSYTALPVCGLTGLYSAFCFGRWFENGKCQGWN